MSEPLLQENKNRFCLFPIQYPDIWDSYKKHKASFWTAEEIDFSADKNDWDTLNENEKYFIEHILAFFAGSDGIVLENLVTNFCKEIPIPEARCFYTFQAMIENIHGEVYSLLIDTYVTDHKRKLQLFNAIEEIPCVEQKATWALKYIDSKNSFAKRLIAFGIVEGLFFSGAFCAIFWLKQRGLMTKSLGKSNEWISRDEGLHTDFAILLYKHIIHKIPQEEVHKMMEEAVKIEEHFICNSLPCRLLGMNQEMMSEYIRYVADRLLFQFGYLKIWNAKNPFPFMNKISLEGKTNFFEQRVTEYVLTSSMSENADIHFDVSDLDNDIF
jgi:ribonucleotide reductase beta subunit family protein with ferritin-like domain